MRGDLSVDGRGHTVPVALAPSTAIVGMLDECRLELCAESIEPSSTWAQLQATCILTMEMRVSAVGAQAGGSNSRIVSRAPI